MPRTTGQRSKKRRAEHRGVGPLRPFRDALYLNAHVGRRTERGANVVKLEANMGYRNLLNSPGKEKFRKGVFQKTKGSVY